MTGCEDPSKLKFDDDTYLLYNVHIHSVSEHEVSIRDVRHDGKYRAGLRNIFFHVLEIHK